MSALNSRFVLALFALMSATIPLTLASDVPAVPGTENGWPLPIPGTENGWPPAIPGTENGWPPVAPGNERRQNVPNSGKVPSGQTPVVLVSPGSEGQTPVLVGPPPPPENIIVVPNEGGVKPAGPPPATFGSGSNVPIPVVAGSPEVASGHVPVLVGDHPPPEMVFAPGDQGGANPDQMVFTPTDAPGALPVAPGPTQVAPAPEQANDNTVLVTSTRITIVTETASPLMESGAVGRFYTGHGLVGQIATGLTALYAVAYFAL